MRSPSIRGEWYVAAFSIFVALATASFCLAVDDLTTRDAVFGGIGAGFVSAAGTTILLAFARDM